ncbi:MAG: hypothetical protein HYZ72_05185 [Deltaproteobacteria bacterium]|nr:hypothetical protein [Deltaproteobacteria bacterium]
MTFIDTLVGISESVERRQEDREWVRLEDDVRGGRLSIVQALHIVVRIQLKKELRSVPWYQFAERRRLKESAKNRRLAIDQVLACTSLQASGLSFKQTCEALYEVERIVVQMSASGQPLPSGQGAIELAEGVFRQVRALSPPVSKEMPFPVEMPSRAVPVVEVRP